jgi:hypothetical protein
MIATTRVAARLIPLTASLPQPIAAILAQPYLYLNIDLGEQERALAVARAEKMAMQGERDKVIRRS